MLIIRTAQMATLSQALDDDFRRRLLAWLLPLARQLELDAAPGFDGERLVAQALAHCRHFGLTRESDIAGYLATALEQPWFLHSEAPPIPALQILLSYGMPPVDKLERFRHWATSCALPAEETHV